MTLKELINSNRNEHAYILGSIFSYSYSDKDNKYFYSVFYGKNQKSQLLKCEQFIDIVRRADKYYKTNISSLFSPINLCDIKFSKNVVGIFSKFQNDIDNYLHVSISEKLKKESKNYILDFIRGVIDARSSGDTTTQYIALDIKKSIAQSWLLIMITAFKRIFGNYFCYNINPRFASPSERSRRKNPQFRIPYTIVFGQIGTFRKDFINKMLQNKNMSKKFQKCTTMPKDFDLLPLIKWNTNKIKYTPRQIKDETSVIPDVMYYKSYNKNNEKILSACLKQEYHWKIKIKVTKKRKKFNKEELYEVLRKSNYNDFLDPNINLNNNKNKNGDPIVHIHHIIPHMYYKMFDKAEYIDDIRNLIPLSPNTHNFIHNGEYNKKKKEYLQQMYDHISKFLIDVNCNINFSQFQQMY